MDLDLNADFDRAIAYCLGLVMNDSAAVACINAGTVSKLVVAKYHYNHTL